MSRRHLIVNRFTIATLKTQLSQGIAFLSTNTNQWKNNMKQQQHESKKKVKKKNTLRHLAKPVSLPIGL